MGSLRRRAFLPALLIAACCCNAVLLASGQQQPVSVDGLEMTDTLPTATEAMPPASSTSMPASTTSAVAPPSAATAAAPAPATPSALATPIDRAAFRMVATCSSLVQLPPRSTSSASRNKTSSPSLLLRPSVKALNATLEMDVTPSYSSVWRGRDGNAGGWRPGRSRLNVSGLISPAAGATAPIAISARLHPLPCLPQGTAMFGPLAYSAATAYRHNGENASETETPASAPGGQPAEILGLKVPSGTKKKSGAAAAADAADEPSPPPSPPTQVAGSATFPFLVDFDAAGSVVLYADEPSGSSGGGGGAGGVGGAGGGNAGGPAPLACCNLSPPPPDFPEEWSAVIEANVRDKGYTLVVRQLYSASNKKVRLDVHSLGNDRVVVQDYKKGTATFIDGPNSTYPFGSCSVARFDELDPSGNDAFGGGGGNGGESKKAKSTGNSTNAADDGSIPVAPGFSSPSSSSSSAPSSPSSSSKSKKKQQQQDAFLPTAAALAFAPGGGAARAKFVPSASFDIRGIPVETWQRRVEEPATNSSYDLLYFFPVNAWLASGEDYHRLLKAIVVNGTQGGQRVYQEFHFVDFRPYGNGGSGGNSANGTGVPAEAFDPCEIAPGAAGCGCDKKKKGNAKAATAAADFAASQAGISAGDRGSSSPSSPPDSSSFSQQQQQQQLQRQPMGLMPSQVGSYVFFLFLGLVAGLLGAFGVPALVGCCCSGRRRSFGRFEEGNGVGRAPTAAVTSAA